MSYSHVPCATGQVVRQIPSDGQHIAQTNPTNRTLIDFITRAAALVEGVYTGYPLTQTFVFF
jgi:hypothetical protein